MDADEALQFVETLLLEQGTQLNDLQRLVFQGAWEGKSYKEIHQECSNRCTIEHLVRNVGPELWKVLSEVLEERITKNNLQGPVERRYAMSSLKRGEAALKQKQPQLVIKRQQHRAQYFVEDLGNDVALEMVLVPAGSFLMGSPEDELGRSGDEGAQHTVTVPTFCFGKYPVTQAQWQAVVALPEVNRELKANPSNFEGENRPVEQVSWYEAVEFCDRLSRHTGRTYRLPSEAEWEYACRAGTTTPFHFGETITTDLANYDGTDDKDGKWSGSYGKGPKGIYRQETTDVGSFKVANAFGLYDMHGNVLEWCSDHWHSNYEGAPTDGSDWLSDDQEENRLLRGGSWGYNPALCRSACRFSILPGVRSVVIGFRVVCSFARTLS